MAQIDVRSAGWKLPKQPINSDYDDEMCLRHGWFTSLVVDTSRYFLAVNSFALFFSGQYC